MKSISYEDYYLRLNSELNHWNGILAILEHSLSKESFNKVTFELLHDLADVHKSYLLEEMNRVTEGLADDGIETGLMVSPIVKGA